MNSGDLVKLRLAREELECTLLESYDGGIYLVKLKSGYNIGIPKENVLGFEVLKKYQSIEKKIEIPKSKGLPSVGLIVTGGTMASKLDAKTGAVSALTDVGEFARFYPKLFEAVNVKIAVPFMKLSENMGHEDWLVLAGAVKKMLDDNEIKGIIITHGTDTLHYTSAALSFFLGKLNKPVVLTYSQRSIDRASSDAELNLECAVRFALSDCAEVVIVGHADMNDDFCFALRGTKVRKMHSSRRDTFKPINCEPIARVYPNKVEFLSSYNACSNGLTKLDTEFSDKIALIHYYPGQDPAILDYHLVQGYKGIIVAATGFGHVAMGDVKNSWGPTIKRLIKQGVIICFAPQTFYGKLNSKVYSPGRDLEALGIIYLRDMLPETAFVKLGWVLGHKQWKGLVREKMLENVSGEFNTLLTA